MLFLALFGIYPNEAFVRQSTSIPRPEAFGFHYNEDDECFIFMSYTGGYNLESTWSRTGNRRQQPRSLFISPDFRALTCPSPATFGSLGTGFCRDSRKMERQCPSITSERQFNEFLGQYTFQRYSIKEVLSAIERSAPQTIPQNPLMWSSIWDSKSTVFSSF